ncbi:hypothetical protein DFJ74DRAFT_649791 [Hyaloraphidium curvatum]|nr:hypothetical protein DFJ74DRAFT_649791 [Hyaloraphidium curvatum]
MSGARPILPMQYTVGPVVPPRRSSRPSSRGTVRTWLLFAACITAGAVAWLLVRRSLSIDDVRAAADGRSWVAGIAGRLLAAEERERRPPPLADADIDAILADGWLDAVLDLGDGGGRNASLRTKGSEKAREALLARLAQHVRPATFVPQAANYDSFAIAVKTGAATAHQRVPVQAASFLRHVRNWILIGEAPGVVVGERPVIDVFSTLYTEPPHPDFLDPHADRPENRTFFHAPKLELPKGAKRLRRRHEDHGKEDAIVPDNAAEGWKKDAHKNLPGFVHLWNAFPNADWYFMIDDDTYLFLENIAKAVEGLNPDSSYYFGAPTLFVGCDGVSKYGEGPQFAHGGSGIMMSRGSLVRMLTIADACIARYRDCWAGDVRTALCLRDAGILLQGHRDLNFHNEPPNSKSWWPEDPCSRPTTFHHLLTWQIQKLYDVDRVQLEARQPTTYGGIFSNFLSEKERKEMATRVDRDVNRQGMDYRHQFSDTPQACAELCHGEARCKSWTWENNTDSAGGECWLKKGIPGKQEKKGATSGTVPKNYLC